MPESTSVRQVADALLVVCDAVYDLVAEANARDAIRRLEEAAASLSDEDHGSIKETADADGIAAALRGIKHLGKAMEALAADSVGRAEMQISSAVDALRAAAALLKASFGDTGEERHGPPVQMSVTEALRVPNKEAINDALRNLLNRTEAQAFVIFVDARTGNFIQFLGSKEEPLVLDLPFSGLSEKEVSRADQYFTSQGIDEAKSAESYSVTVGRDVARATELALGVFNRVYGSEPDFSLKIEEN